MKKVDFRNRIPISSDFLSTAASRQTLVELLGTKRLLIENHKGICAYSNINICVRTCYGYLSVTGKYLNIIKMTKDQLIICGDIQGVIPERESIP